MDKVTSGNDGGVADKVTSNGSEEVDCNDSSDDNNSSKDSQSSSKKAKTAASSWPLITLKPLPPLQVQSPGTDDSSEEEVEEEGEEEQEKRRRLIADLTKAI